MEENFVVRNDQNYVFEDAYIFVCVCEIRCAFVVKVNNEQKAFFLSP